MATRRKTPICITGGSGFIGKAIVRLLVQKNAGEITVIDHNPPEPEVAAKVRYFNADFFDAKVLDMALAEGAILIHLAGISNQATAEKDPVRDGEVSVVGTLKLLEAAVAKRISKVIFMSSVGVYGEVSRVPVEVSAVPKPRSVYGITKFMLEQYVKHFAEKSGSSCVIFRAANIYGPGQVATTHGVVSIFARKILKGGKIELWGSPETKRDFVYIDDVARAVVAAAQFDVQNKLLHIASGKGTALKSVIREVEKASKRKANVVLMGKRAIDAPDMYFSIRDTKKALGWSPKIKFADGVRRTVAWIQEAA